jgi:hypothetical protein
MGRKIVRDAREESLDLVQQANDVQSADAQAAASPVYQEGSLGAQLRAARDRLNEETDRLNGALAEVQGLLDEIRVGVRATVEMPNGKTLAYGPLGGHWCLHVEDTKTPILHSSREDRLLAAGALDALVDSLLEEAKRKVAAVEAAKATVDGVHQTIVEALR